MYSMNRRFEFNRNEIHITHKRSINMQVVAGFEFRIMRDIQFVGQMLERSVIFIPDDVSERTIRPVAQFSVS